MQVAETLTFESGSYQPWCLVSLSLTMPLKVIIVGAGLGGLGAAIAFTRAGHDVEVCVAKFWRMQALY